MYFMLDPFLTYFLMSVEEIPIGVTLARNTFLLFGRAVLHDPLSPLSRPAKPAFLMSR